MRLGEPGARFCHAAAARAWACVSACHAQTMCVCVCVCACAPAGGDDGVAGATAGVAADELDDDWGLDGDEAA
jgi:hypothetical protein